MGTTDNPFLRDHTFLDRWDFRFICLAEEVSTWSKDPNRKVGCVLVRERRDFAKGYNGFPPGISDDLRLLNAGFKGKVIIHAEMNAILNAVKFGVSTIGSTAYVTYHPCASCASVLIGAGIEKIICPPPSAASPKWAEDFKMASDLLVEADIPVLYYNLKNAV